MKISRALTVLIAAVSFSMGIGLLAAPCFAQDATASSPVSFPNTKHVLGLDGVKHDASGVLTVENGSLEFTKGKQKVVVPASSIKEVLTDKDTERTLGGTAGTLTLLVPYGGGRFLSLFRTKIDNLSLEYVDASGGVHGVIFIMAQGNAAGAKTALLSQGAKTSVPVEVEAQQQAKPKEKKQ